MKIKKRDNTLQDYNKEKIMKAIKAAFASQNNDIDETVLIEIVKSIEDILMNDRTLHNVEHIQDLVEEKLMEHQFYKEAKAYILYRQKHTEERELLVKFEAIVKDEQLIEVMRKIQRDFGDEVYSLELLYQKFQSFIKVDMSKDEQLEMLMKASAELISKQAPKWEFIAARFLTYQLNAQIDSQMMKLNIHSFAEKIAYLESEGYYGKYIREAYQDDEIAELETYMKEERNYLFTYSGLELVVKRYLIQNNDHDVLEKVQEMFMGIAMHLAIPEKEKKVSWAKEIYDILSTLKVTMATPTMSNARKPYHQLSSCFIDTVGDSLTNIYKSIDNFAQVSKFGGGMGLYFGKVRAIGSDIRGFKGAAGGVIRWIKLVNDTATAVDQLGMRQGAVAVYLDAWHKDLPEFLSLRTNNGDDRMKAHDVFPAVCYPDLFWKLAKENIDAEWSLMCPHEILKVKGYALEDSFGKEWEEKYWDCVQDIRISKRVMKVKDLIRLILKSAVETGTPFTFNRDHVNAMNPNPHQGMIYCSNLCTEIAQNMHEIEMLPKEIIKVDDEEIIVEKSKPGDFVVCNLASLILGNIDVENQTELKHTIDVVVRALDNVIDLNYYPVPYAEVTNQKYRSIGLGTSGYHHMLSKHGIAFESEEHLTFVDKVYDDINYYTIHASMELAKEKDYYSLFKGSDWDNGAYFDKRNYTSERWTELRADVKQYGIRNAYLMAIAPTSSTSIIAGTTAAVDPIMNKYFLEEKKGSMIARVAPDLDGKTYWLYKNAHQIDQRWVIDAAGIRQRHIDQAQSVNLYVTNEYRMSELLNLYIRAWERGVKTIYYVRSKALEVEECESCAS
ncbi:ribonucleoside-diphosphate reductase alpha chain [Breznakia sp. PF5-3]|uniref:ribonucleoside-diphosphate reductase subunit alpha n=1 Tax=unclassified Breznakia TaxID=2623764 RepID=UPI002405D665|nr:MULTISPECIES: ribonucleoside-diphosphate reductase subunit alpha [unclassified Breznakia]MDF9824854.1 ribonucleoside-diphosphate reductase alpha chain [Breznakia sp. PM6-1]MDF9835711.1 ribonucleoside-diphosphate reductase alpha chain [Breznakia sp. PF5-3]MDF9838271.1 ribonucleoside-diphosphate reductase alpha chain [Breznakia sp. PFB2-8]MDF9860290.1 ribonucleoside-diphosphate reductase alpha chain [Breznakia sp. PH5-24]